jgi:hypothetical protein
MASVQFGIDFFAYSNFQVYLEHNDFIDLKSQELFQEN